MKYHKLQITGAETAECCDCGAEFSFDEYRRLLSTSSRNSFDEAFPGCPGRRDDDEVRCVHGIRISVGCNRCGPQRTPMTPLQSGVALAMSGRRAGKTTAIQAQIDRIADDLVKKHAKLFEKHVYDALIYGTSMIEMSVDFAPRFIGVDFGKETTVAAQYCYCSSCEARRANELAATMPQPQSGALTIDRKMLDALIPDGEELSLKQAPPSADEACVCVSGRSVTCRAKKHWGES